VKIARVIRETFDTSSFVLEPVDHSFHATSGQFITFVLRSHTGREIRRSYSLSSSPELGEPMTVTIRRIPNGEISRYFLDRVKEGDVFNTVGASGLFTLPDNIRAYKNVLFFAAGSGITPVYSLLKTVLHLHAGVHAILIYSSRNTADTIFYEQLRELQKKFPERLEVHLLFSVSADLTRSRLTPALLENFLYSGVPHFRDALHYVCGPTDYMRMVQYTLSSLGVAAAQIKREIFFIQRPTAIAIPPDTEEHTVHIVAGTQTHSVLVKYPVTILQAAKSGNIPLSYSCENGQCGTCVAECLQGEVWMSRNEILLPGEVAKGRVLTCTAYPVNGDVTIKI
jgi:ferredoxin-NADP reductase